ncbi:LysR family transcriptional regulator [Microbacterium sp. HD4P20]|uniref:LysR family transcriptional regulator n=1 Tax=Microbacterium sp. HD4P20 TaxID=2864874 RepID=UPI001C642F2B|nr:LysR family transcriptional regulator [Microbacterium sp. HD4P20]MCP2638529.1 LysR family transcriptional regulator [Microbacterium sp. HD4P20]
MSLRQFEYFVTIAEEESMTRAAARLNVTQPALSHQLAALERHLGINLFARTGRSVRLTMAGHAVLPHARATLAAADRAKLAAVEAMDLMRGELRVATVYSISLGLLPIVLSWWTASHPEVDLRLAEHRHADAMAHAVLTADADVAIGPLPAGWHGPRVSLGREEFVVALAADDPLAGSTAPDLSVLAGRRWVHYSRDNGLAAILDRACDEAGFSPSAAVRVEQTASAPALAAAGIGPSLVPSNMLAPDFPGGVMRLRHPPHRELAVFGSAEGGRASERVLMTFDDVARRWREQQGPQP